MKIRIVAATEGEIKPLIDACHEKWTQPEPGVFVQGSLQVEFLITGVGMMRTSYALGRSLAQNKPELCINAGIAGAFPGKFSIGDVVHVVSDCVSEMGATDSDGRHLSMQDMHLAEDISSTDGLINNAAGAFDFLPRATGITVNTVHGDTAGITKVQEQFSADIETMESAAFFYCCIKENVPFLALRAISNIVEPRDRSSWNIPLAVSNLNAQLVELLDLLMT